LKNDQKNHPHDPPLEIVPDVSNQTRAAQITGTTLETFTVDVTGSFVDANC
jgi:hypothetical protein